MSEKRDVIDRRHGEPISIDLSVESGFKFGLGLGCAYLAIVFATFVVLALGGRCHDWGYIKRVKPDVRRSLAFSP